MRFIFPVFCGTRFNNFLKIKPSLYLLPEYKTLRFIYSTMPLEKLHMKQAKAAFEKKKTKDNFFHSSFLFVQVVGSGAHGAPRSVSLVTDAGRYLFNCGEGTQRISTEFKIKISKMQHIFVTYPSWENISGLVGVALTVQSIGIPELFIHGHPCIENVYSATNKFATLRTTKISIMECNTNSDFDDNIIQVKYVKLFPTLSSNLSKNFSDSEIVNQEKTHADSTANSRSITPTTSSTDEETDDFKDNIDYYEYLYDGKGHNSREKKFIQNKNKNKNKRSQSEAYRNRFNSHEKYATSFIIKSRSTPGTLHVEKCVDLGLKPGPLFGKLKMGEDVLLENGKLIRSTDVKDPDTPGCIIIVVECPSEDYLDALLKEPTFTRYQTGQHNLDETATLVIHFTASEIVKHPKYEEWINRFSKEIKHLFINEDNQSIGPLYPYEQQHQLNLLHPEIFPLFSSPFSTLPEVNCDDLESDYKVVDANSLRDFKIKKYFLKFNKSNVLKGETLCEVYLRPIKKYDFSYTSHAEPQKYIDEAVKTQGFFESIEKFKTECNKMKEVVDRDEREYPKILFLGTGSSQPFKHRNTSGILVHVDKKNAIIFDCGEGTYTQIVRFFGKNGAREVLRNLSFIYISHMHADHHLGLITLLRQRKLAFEEIDAVRVIKPEEKKSGKILEENNLKFHPIYIFSPLPLTRWLNLYSQEFENINDLYEIIPNTHLCIKSYSLSQQMECKKKANLKEIVTTLVDHCPNAFGIAITHNDGWKLTYSGDTKPCTNLVEIGLNSDILIHEATFDDGREREAALKLHSTTKQAVSIGEQMNAKFILLTHFSQRYSHLPLLNENFKDNVGFAFDYMMVSMKHLPLLPKMNKALKILFLESYEKMEEKIRLQMLNELKRKGSSQAEIDAKISKIVNYWENLFESTTSRPILPVKTK